MKKIIYALLIAPIVYFTSCDEGKLNFFTVDQDMEFGRQLDSAIMANPIEYPLLSETAYPQAYSKLRSIRNALIQTGHLRYGNTFEWKVKIIRDDNILNAFAAPGGYMYFYTGLIKFLDNEAQFAGVMAHEMAHADRRHSTEMLTKQYGLSLLVSIVLGENPTMLEEILGQLALGGTLLKYSRDNEYEADEYAVKYLYSTTYHARELAGFFEKLHGSPQPPEFLSTHPSPENRIQKIEEAWQRLGGKVGQLYVAQYQQFKNSLP